MTMLNPELIYAREEAVRQRRFEKEKVCFEQNSEHLRSLNGLMWQVPLIAMTLTGGLWYGIAQLQPNSIAVQGLLILACATDALLILVMLRMRFIFRKILEKTKEFYPKGIANTDHKVLFNALVCTIFCMLLALAASLSGYAVFNTDKLISTKNAQDSTNNAFIKTAIFSCITEDERKSRSAVQ